MNIYLKEIMQLAGFAERVETGRTKGGTKDMTYCQKWELISTHTARWSFATNAYLAGLPTIAIMQCTGHSSEVMFMKYIKVSSEQNALLLLNHPHFGGTGATNPLNTVVRPLHKAA